MKCFSRLPILLPLFGVSLLSLPVLSQQGAVSFKHFRTYPNGEWSQELQAYRNGELLGPVQKSTTCSGPLTRSQAAAVVKMGNDAAPMCTTKVLKDEERTVEYEQVCHIGPQEQVIHSTMRAIDDRTTQTEIRHTVGGTEMSFTRLTNRYEGPCTAPTMPVIPAMPKPPAEECAQIPAMKKQAQEALQGCTSSDTPETERAGCIAAMKRMSTQVQQIEAQCK